MTFLIVLVALGGFIVLVSLSGCPAMGSRLRCEQSVEDGPSAYLANGRFQNHTPTEVMPEGTFGSTTYRLLFGKEERVPRTAPPVRDLTAAALAEPPESGLRPDVAGPQYGAD